MKLVYYKRVVSMKNVYGEVVNIFFDRQEIELPKYQKYLDDFVVAHINKKVNDKLNVRQ